MSDSLVFTNAVGEAIDALVADMNPAGVFVVADTNTASLCLPQLRSASEAIGGSSVLVAEAGEEHKTIDTAVRLWRSLVVGGATRRSLVVNVGGGVVTDMGGFVAATFKRGMPYINVPTTLLAAVDASVGGKTAVNFEGLKNEIGSFAMPAATVLSTRFFATLPREQMLSGYAEMLKHALLSGPEALGRALAIDDPAEVAALDAFLPVLRESVAVKQRIVAADPTEKGLRKVLNLGHTVGHAVEALSIENGRAVPHGYVVAWGCVVALVISHMELGFPSDVLHRFAMYVRDNYGALPASCDDYPELLRIMSHDKKNSSPDSIVFTLLSAPGAPVYGHTVTPAVITVALDIARDMLG